MWITSGLLYVDKGGGVISAWIELLGWTSVYCISSLRSLV